MLESFQIDSKLFLNLLIFFSKFHHFLTSRRSTSSLVKPYLEVYRGPNPLAQTSAITPLRHTKSQKWMFLREIFNFSQKKHLKIIKKSFRPRVCFSEYFVCKAGGKLSTWLPPVGLAQQVLSINLCFPLFFYHFFHFLQKL